MRLQDLRVTDFRNLSDLRLSPCRGLNIVAGPNASGKTALLEAIFLLSRGRSFRTGRIRELIQDRKPRLQVAATLVDERERGIPIGVERDHHRLRARFNGITVNSQSEQARHFPIVLITPDSHGLMTGAPGLRRHWLDWALFHVERDYLQDWRACFHALRQRNALLKRRASDNQLSPWEQALAVAADRLDAARQAFCERLSVGLADASSLLLPGAPGVHYRRGWDPDRSYGEILRARRGQDSGHGFTGAGPHRADLDFRHDGRPARSLLSRGQIKLYLAGLMLALARILAEAGSRPVILVDDLPAELDAGARERLLQCLAATGCQTFATAIETDRVQPGGWPQTAVFHVEHGRISEMVQ